MLSHVKISNTKQCCYANENKTLIGAIFKNMSQRQIVQGKRTSEQHKPLDSLHLVFARCCESVRAVPESADAVCTDRS